MNLRASDGSLGSFLYDTVLALLPREETEKLCCCLIPPVVLADDDDTEDEDRDDMLRQRSRETQCFQMQKPVE